MANLSWENNKRAGQLNKVVAEHNEEINNNYSSDHFYLNQGQWPVGKHKGTLILELEDYYLKYVVEKFNEKHLLAGIAKKELNRRGIPLPTGKSKGKSRRLQAIAKIQAQRLT